VGAAASRCGANTSKQRVDSRRDGRLLRYSVTSVLGLSPLAFSICGRNRGSEIALLRAVGTVQLAKHDSNSRLDQGHGIAVTELSGKCALSKASETAAKRNLACGSYPVNT
jgi:hypothetical protein